MKDNPTILSFIAIGTAIAALSCVAILSYVTAHLDMARSGSLGNSGAVIKGVEDEGAEEANTVVPSTTPAVATATYQAPSVAQSNLPPCTANDITGSANWQGAGGALSGALVITNSSRSACSLSHDDYVAILSDGRAVPTLPAANPSPGSYTDLAAGERVSMRFVWSNWCGAGYGGEKSVKFVLPSNRGYLDVPVIDASGRHLSDVPRCDSPQSASSLSIWAM